MLEITKHAVWSSQNCRKSNNSAWFCSRLSGSDTSGWVASLLLLFFSADTQGGWTATVMVDINIKRTFCFLQGSIFWHNFAFNIAGHEINNVYFPIFVPIGVIGNILSFMVRSFVVWDTNTELYVNGWKLPEIPCLCLQEQGVLLTVWILVLS